VNSIIKDAINELKIFIPVKPNCANGALNKTKTGLAQ